MFLKFGGRAPGNCPLPGCGTVTDLVHNRKGDLPI